VIPKLTVTTPEAAINGHGCPSTVVKRCGTLPLTGKGGVEAHFWERQVSGPRGDDTGDDRSRLAASAIVTFADDEWVLRDGESLSFGRQSTCELLIGAPETPGPEDLGVSRQAGTLICAGGSIWVRNDSATQALYVHCSGRGFPRLRTPLVVSAKTLRAREPRKALPSVA
jgi:hypothetical protein